ncbi:MAG TPA: error-prone DNA polymerase [Chthoniobacteraceae bacterium]|nr:error-prone DNA polymerase [Chthoniobacteraceae bacterium]
MNVEREGGGYVELHARSAFSFLRGASQPEALAHRAAELGLPAIGLCDRDGLYGAPRFYAAAREAGVRAIVGAELTLEDGSVLPVLVQNRTGYQNLSRLITKAKLRGTKELAPVHWDDLPEFAQGLICLSGDAEGPIRRALARGDLPAAHATLERLTRVFGRDGVYVEIQRHLERGEMILNETLCDLAQQTRLPLLATGGILYAGREGRKVLDAFTCIRHHTHLDAAGLLLSRNAERQLKPARAMRALFADLPEAVEESVRLAGRLDFSLENLGYEFPTYPVPPGESTDSFLRRVTLEGARSRYPKLRGRVMEQLERELALIAQLGFSGYFLIVWDIANFCRENDILMQGRGSAANSAVCYSLGITACDPIGNELLFERFLSEGRQGWPDIDLDLPSGDRRERAIQELYRRYGEHGAAMTANVITYRGRSAMREIGKTLNLSPDLIARCASLFTGGDFPHTLELEAHLAQAGFPREHGRMAAFATLYRQIVGLPRHLGQHSGGMIICQGKLDAMVPLERASMPGRVVAQWDKDDCEDLGIIKVDLLGLGMMSVLQDSLTLCEARGRGIDRSQIPHDDPAVFELMQRADTIGLFQIESRAQMATLPRLKPACFYDVVIEVAIIRPGPIQGDLIHPYLNRRAGREPADCIHPLLEPVLKRTLGVPLFQEQILKIAMVMADFSGAEAEELRRAMSFHRSHERMAKVLVKLRRAMEERSVPGEAIDKIERAVTSFALYGFPESHAISFANLVWTSAWLKVHRSAEFFAALLNNQPMGFYSPATLVRDARRHGLRFEPVSVVDSQWECTVTDDRTIRLGLCMVRGVSAPHVRRMLEERSQRPFASWHDWRVRTGFDRDERRTLARVGALNPLPAAPDAGRPPAHRRELLWQVEEGIDPDDLFSWGRTRRHGCAAPPPSPLEPMTLPERITADYHGTGLTIGPHPMTLLRHEFPDAWRAADLPQARDGERITIAGNVICRQRPGTAKGFVFVSLEDESGISNAIIAPALFERLRLLITGESFLAVTGIVQNRENVVLIRAETILPFPRSLQGAASHDFH